MNRGELRVVECSNTTKLKCGCNLVYGQASDNNYYLRDAKLDHQGANCLRTRPESAAENRARGKHEIPEHSSREQAWMTYISLREEFIEVSVGWGERDRRG